MGNYVTYEQRNLPHIGWDPCPGSPGGTRDLATMLATFSARAGEMAAFIDGAGDDYRAWSGESSRKFQAAMVEFPPKLHETVRALEAAESALTGWAGELAEFQSRSALLDTQLGEWREIHRVESSKTYLTVPGEPVNFGRSYEGGSPWEAARLQVERLEAQVEAIHAEYLDRARYYGGLLNEAGDMVWSHGWWATFTSHVDDLGDWLEDSWAGDFARWAAPVLGVVSEWGANLALLSTVAAGVAFLIPGAQVAVPFLLGAAGIFGGLALAADTGLAIGGQGGWDAVGLGVVTLGLGKGVAAATRRVVNTYRGARADQLVRVGNHSYAPSMFTATEMTTEEVVWRSIRMKGNQAVWAIDGTGAYDRFNAWGEQDPWDLPRGAAYLEDKDGELVK